MHALLEPDATPPLAAHRRGRTVLVARVAAGSVAAAAIVVALRSAPPARASVGIALLAALVVLTPVARNLSRRLLIIGAALLGWVQVLWWIDLSWLAVDRTSLLLAAWAAGLTGWVLAGTSPRSRCRELVPELRAVDALPVLGGVIGLAAFADRIVARDPARALDTLLGGWDNAGHFAMFHMIRIRGVIVPEQAPPDDALAWGYAQYPQGYHALASSVGELLGGAYEGNVLGDVLLFSRATAVLATAGCVVILAGICSLEPLRRRVLALPVSAVALTALCLGTGYELLRWGFPNFLLATTLAATLFFLTFRSRGPGDLPMLVAATGATVGIAHGWFPLAAIAGPLALAAAGPLRRSTWRLSRVRWISVGALALCTLAAIAYSQSILESVDAKTSLGLDGGFPAEQQGAAVVITVSALALSLLRCSRMSGSSARDDPQAWAALLAVSTGIGTAIFIAVFQQVNFGRLTYYFWKFEAGLVLFCVLVGVSQLGLLLAGARLPVGRAARATSIGAVAVAALATTQAAGLVVPNIERTTTFTSITSPRPEPLALPSVVAPIVASTDLVNVAAMGEERPDQTLGYLAYPTDHRTIAKNTQQWALGLTDHWTDVGDFTYASMPDGALDSPEAAAELAISWLRTVPSLVVAVRAEAADDVIPLVVAADPSYVDRIEVLRP